jgi:hypothetical protein
MFDTIILLSGEAERRALPFALFGHNPKLTVKPVQTLADLDALDSNMLARAADLVRDAGDCIRRYPASARPRRVQFPSRPAGISGLGAVPIS